VQTADSRERFVDRELKRGGEGRGRGLALDAQREHWGTLKTSKQLPKESTKEWFNEEWGRGADRQSDTRSRVQQ
jgi:hypothetical protein